MSFLFQSLLYWISHCGGGASAGLEKKMNLFQSLLYWISHCGNPNDHYPVRDVDVSILVVLD